MRLAKRRRFACFWLVYASSLALFENSLATADKHRLKGPLVAPRKLKLVLMEKAEMRPSGFDRFLIWVLFIGLIGLPPTVTRAETKTDTGPIAIKVAELQDLLEKGLKARRPEEFQFIGKVVVMVKNDQLPVKIVLETFHWVRKNRPKAKSLMIYFERVLRIRAAKAGIVIP